MEVWSTRKGLDFPSLLSMWGLMLTLESGSSELCGGPSGGHIRKGKMGVLMGMKGANGYLLIGTTSQGYSKGKTDRRSLNFLRTAVRLSLPLGRRDKRGVD